MSMHTEYDPDYERKKRRRAIMRKRRLIRDSVIAGLVLFALLILFLLGFGVYKLVGIIARGNEYSPSGSRHVDDSVVYVTGDLDFIDNQALALIPDDLASQEKDEEEVDLSEINNRPAVEPGINGLIIIDAGHGGYDGGTISAYDASNEKDINLAIAYLVKEELEYRGYSIYMTRTDDSFVGLNERAALANNQSRARAFISVHQNSIDDYPNIAGVESWTFERAGCTELALALSDAVAAETGENNRGVNYRTNLVVTSKTTMPAAIIECGYLSNPDTAAKLITEEYQQKIALGIANGLESFIAEYYK